MTLGQIHEAEAAVEAARKTSAAAAERLDTARLALREQQAAQQEEAGEATLVGVPVEIKVGLGSCSYASMGNKLNQSAARCMGGGGGRGGNVGWRAGGDEGGWVRPAGDIQ